MRHNKQGRKLKRTASHRKALLASLSTALILHKRIQTTTAKAKEARRIIEPIITRARDAYLSEQGGNATDVHARREVYRFIRDRKAIQILFSEIAEKVGKRPGGYTRVLPLGNRLGDGASMSVIELVDYNDAQDNKQRRERAAKSKAAAQRRKAAEDRKVAVDERKPVEAAAVEVAETPVADASTIHVDQPVQDVASEAVASADAAVADAAPAAEAPATDTAADAAAEEPKA
jgi:large subunit ribosomal protein L17